MDAGDWMELLMQLVPEVRARASGNAAHVRALSASVLTPPFLQHFSEHAPVATLDEGNVLLDFGAGNFDQAAFISTMNGATTHGRCADGCLSARGFVSQILKQPRGHLRACEGGCFGSA